MTHDFIRQMEAERNSVSLVVPQRSKLPNMFAFATIPYSEAVKAVEHNSTVSDGINEFPMRDGVLTMFENIVNGYSEYGWSFASSRVVDVLAAIKVGRALQVSFDIPFAEVHHISRYHFPSGEPDSGYGEYSVYISEEGINENGFYIVSSFEEGKEVNSSRLPFFFGFRVYGQSVDSEPEPVWRSLLALAIRYCQEKKWHLSVLHSSFCLESMIDTLLKQAMLSAGLPEDYIEHILLVGEKRNELFALNNLVLKGTFTPKDMGRKHEELNKSVFKKRNSIAHGKKASSSMGHEDAIEALRKTVSFIWDFSPSSRRQLLVAIVATPFTKMIDEALLESCRQEVLREIH